MSRRGALAGALVAVAVLAAACGGGTTPSAPTTGPSPHPDRTRPIDPNFDAGQVVLITNQGFHPKVLVAEIGRDVVWRNTTSTTQAVVLLHGAGRSGPIAPGASYRFHPDVAVAYAYFDEHDPNNTGFVQVEPRDVNDTLPPAP